MRSGDFRVWWSQHEVYRCTSGKRRLDHPLVGRVDIDHLPFPAPREPDQHLFVHSAQTGSPSADAQRILASLGRSASPRADRHRQAAR